MKYYLILCVLIICIINGIRGQGKNTAVLDLFTNTQSGEGTYYSYSGGGDCTLTPTPPTGSGAFSTVAIATNQYRNSITCGMCINVTATGTGKGNNPLPTTPQFVFVNDLCPSCGSNGLDFGLGLDGEWGIIWNAIECTLTSNIQYVLQGSNSYYTKLQIRNTRFPVNSVYLNVSGKLVSTTKTSDNFFLYNGLVSYPLAIRIYGIDGQCLEDEVPTLSNNNVMDGNVQFSTLNSNTCQLQPPNASLHSSQLNFYILIITLLTYLIYFI